MKDLDDLKVMVKAFEFLHYGVDITDYTREDYRSKYVNFKTGKVISRFSNNVAVKFCVKLEDSLMELLQLRTPYAYRLEKEFYISTTAPEAVEVVDVTKEVYINTMRLLYAKGVSKFKDFDKDTLDPEYAARMQWLRENFNRYVEPESGFLTKLSKANTRKNFLKLMLSTYTGDTLKMMLDAYDKNWDSFDIKGFERYTVYDNRIYIPLSELDLEKVEGTGWEGMKYVVVSKNLYDYFFSSYGSDFQSCYSITSDFRGWLGMYPLGAFKDHYIIYGTKNHPQTTSIDDSGKKWDTPFMYFRCWGWVDASDGSLLLDKIYTSDSCNSSKASELLKSLGMVGEERNGCATRQGKEMLAYFSGEQIGFYPDSVYVREAFKYCRGNADRCSRGDKDLAYFKQVGHKGNLKAFLNNVKDVSDTLDINKPYELLNGVFINPKFCPITNLKIDSSLERSEYAKYVGKPVENTLVVNYDDGYFWLLAATNRDGNYSHGILVDKDYESELESSAIYFGDKPSRARVSLDKTKNFLQQHINGSMYDVILLRVVDNSKVQFIKYNKKGKQ